LKDSRTFIVEIIATGNELIFGRLVDTNSAWIAGKVIEHGGTVRRIICVGDSSEEIKLAVQESLARGCDLLVVTGGLGPTPDDLTMKAIAQAVDRSTQMYEKALEELRAKYEKLSKERGMVFELTPQRRKMASVVEGSEHIANKIGLAVGMKLKVDGTLIVALPGVPDEMKPMFEGSVVPIIIEKTGKHTAAKILRVKMPWYGVLQPIVDKVLQDFHGVYIKIYAGDIKPDLGIKVDILARGETYDGCERTLGKIVDRLRTHLAGKGSLTLET